jgi:hypothetical protein
MAMRDGKTVFQEYADIANIIGNESDGEFNTAQEDTAGRFAGLDDNEELKENDEIEYGNEVAQQFAIEGSTSNFRKKKRSREEISTSSRVEQMILQQQLKYGQNLDHLMGDQYSDNYDDYYEDYDDDDYAGLPPPINDTINEVPLQEVAPKMGEKLQIYKMLTMEGKRSIS